MKIGLVRRGYSATGGAEAYLRRFAVAATEAGHQCVLYATPDWPKEEWPGPIERVTKARSPTAFADQLNAMSAQYVCDALFSLERVWACDIYRAGDGVHAAWLQRRARFEPAWRSWFRRYSGKHRELLGLENNLFRDGGTHRVIANSQLVADEIVWRFGFPRERIEVIYNGLPAQTIRPEDRAAVRAELDLAESDYVALFAGSGWERKGLRFALEAVQRTPAVTLLIAGRGKTRGLGTSERLRFLGARRDMPRLLAAADVFILPTIYDPFSNACLEALAAGLPVITSAANGFAEIIATGMEGEIVAQPDDIPALVAALEKWRDPATRSAIRPRLVALGARYSIEENVRLTLAVIEAAQH
jgi:UDP-glucose:(heptosyl)LPS alpha-1,3-glucosyltransferase